MIIEVEISSAEGKENYLTIETESDGWYNPDAVKTIMYNALNTALSEDGLLFDTYKVNAEKALTTVIVNALKSLGYKHITWKRSNSDDYCPHFCIYHVDSSFGSRLWEVR